MPLTIITLTNSTPSLRGDLSKWMQEIDTGVYVGNFNSRIREHLWQRVIDSVGSGSATLSYAARNELGYQFESYNTERQMLTIEGIPLVWIPNNQVKKKDSEQKFGFSYASKYRRVKKYRQKAIHSLVEYVIIDIETTGLDFKRDGIIEIAALLIRDDQQYVFEKLIANRNIPEVIQKMTGISQEMICEMGVEEATVLQDFIEFIGERVLVGYNISFDIKFLNSALEHYGHNIISNPIIDLKSLVKNQEMFLKNYKLETVVRHFNLTNLVDHRALSDVKLMYELIGKLNRFEAALVKKA